MRELYIKDDSVNHPTLSYKDRVVSVAATRAKELGFEVLACASTGNLANSVAAHAARLGMECCVFIPDNLEAGKLLGSAIFGPTILAIAGNYDDVNRLCTQVADRYGWGFVNINLRSYYAEGAKTMGFEIVEQLGWRYPAALVSPVAGGTLLPRIVRGLRELRHDRPGRGRAAARPRRAGGRLRAGRHALEAGLDHPEPVRPNTIAKSIAIGNPADGYQVIADASAPPAAPGTAVSDAQIVDAIRAAGGNRRHLHRAGRRHDARGDDRPDSARHHSAGRIGGRLHYRQRLQDRRSGAGTPDGTGPPQPRVQGIRVVAGERQALA